MKPKPFPVGFFLARMASIGTALQPAGYTGEPAVRKRSGTEKVATLPSQ